MSADQSEATINETGASNGVIPVARDLVKEITEDDVTGLAAEVAYHAIFSIPALLVVLLALAAIIDSSAGVDLSGRLEDTITESAPESLQDTLTAIVENAIAQVGSGTASIGLATALLVALWAGSNAVGVLMKAFNRAYDSTEQRGFPKMKAWAVMLTVLMGLFVNLALSLWVFGGQIGRWIAEEFSMGSTFDWAWNLARIPGGAFVIILMLGVLYYIGPTVEQRFRWVLPGAFFATIVWGLLSAGFSLYLRFASPGSAYGALSGLIVFLFFLYLTALVLLVGAEFNAVLAKRHDARYRQAIHAGNVESEAAAAVPKPARPGTSVPVSVGALAIGAVTTVGVVLAAAIGRKR